MQDLLSQVTEVQVNVVLLVGVVNVLEQLGNALGVGFRLKLVALLLQQLSQGSEVVDDTVVHNNELTGRVRTVRVTVWSGGLTVGSPSGVGNTDVVVEDLGSVVVLLGNESLQVLDLTWGLGDIVSLLFGAVDGQTGRVIASVF